MYKRSTRTLIMEVLIPIILVIIGLGFSKISFVFESPPRELLITEFPMKQRMLSVNQSVVRNGSDIAPQFMLSQLPDFGKAYEVEFKDYAWVNASNEPSAILREYDIDLYQMAQREPLLPNRYLSFL
mmetsp:Transcript_44285/g.32278  ORF Transcript_44285/g.32278 Transcript_44285/m.32278 type:complete len:127 (+) Transcript_44285:1177-1557(+)